MHMGQSRLILNHPEPEVCRRSARLRVTPVYWTLLTWKAVCAPCIWASTCLHWLHAGSTFPQGCSPAYSGGKFILERCSAGHAVSQASMSQAWQRVWPTFSHAGRCFNPGRGRAGGVVLFRQVAMEQRGDAAAGGACKVSVEGSKSGHLLLQRSSIFSLGFVCNVSGIMKMC